MFIDDYQPTVVSLPPLNQAPKRHSQRLAANSGWLFYAACVACVCVLLLATFRNIDQPFPGLAVGLHLLAALFVAQTVRLLRIGQVWPVWAVAQWVLVAPLLLGTNPMWSDRVLEVCVAGFVLGIGTVMRRLPRSALRRDAGTLTKPVACAALALFIGSGLSLQFAVMSVATLIALTSSPTGRSWLARVTTAFWIILPTIALLALSKRDLLLVTIDRIVLEPFRADQGLPTGLLAQLSDSMLAPLLTLAMLASGVAAALWVGHLWRLPRATDIKVILMTVLCMHAFNVLIYSVARLDGNLGLAGAIQWPLSLVAMLVVVPWLASGVFSAWRVERSQTIGTVLLCGTMALHLL